MNQQEKSKKPKVRSSINVNPAKDLNEWAQHIYELGNQKRGYAPKKDR